MIHLERYRFARRFFLDFFSFSYLLFSGFVFFLWPWMGYAILVPGLGPQHGGGVDEATANDRQELWFFPFVLRRDLEEIPQQTPLANGGWILEEST